jgi:hypothetical protein
MVLRLVLVSIVAGLGVSPPAENELAAWSRSVETWLDAQLAEWNRPALLEEGATATPAVASVAVPSDEPVLASAPAPAPANASAPALSVSETEATPASDTDDAELDALLADDPVTIEPAPIVVKADAPAPAPEGPSEFDAVVEEMVADFVRVDASSPDQGLSEAGAENDGTAATALVSLPAAGYELIELYDDLYPGLAFELNRQSEGIATSASASATESTPAVAEVLPLPAAPMDPEAVPSQLGQAVRLTRDALHAWMNLLQSPAIVTMSR